MSVSVIIVTRGDVDLAEIVEALPKEWEIVVWDNGRPEIRIYEDDYRAVPTRINWRDRADLAVYGRYAAIEHAKHELIYVQDDDCIVSDPFKLVSTWVGSASLSGPAPADGSDLENVETRDHVVCNMPMAFRARHFYDEHSLVGFGAVFHRDAPKRAFQRAGLHKKGYIDTGAAIDTGPGSADFFRRTCDIVFTALTPRVLVDIPYEDMPWASADNRMWKQPTHQEERQRMLDAVLEVARQ